MKTITDEQYWFLQAAWAYFRYESTSTATGHKRKARRLWSKMVKGQTELHRESKRQEDVA